MSQKVKIIKVKHKGASLYLGDDKWGNPTWTRDPDRIMEYLCDGWRYRFNQFRATRTRGVKVVDEKTQEVSYKQVPLGGEGTPPAPLDSEAKANASWLVSIPSRVFQSAKYEENRDWFAALRRIKTSGGRAPGFRSRRRSPQSFICFSAGGDNAVFEKLSSNVGQVTIKGQMPKRMAKDGVRWQIQMRVRISEPIREYTSVKVNWSDRTLVFVNQPLPIDRKPTDKEVGVDLGVTHTLAMSTGEFYDIPKESFARREKYVKLQRRLARRDRVNGPKTTSQRRKAILREMQAISERETNRRKDWIHQTTCAMIKSYDNIAMENLQVKNMSKRGRGKRGLNRAILRNNWGEFREVLTYKAKYSEVGLTFVDPAYTSQTCSKCGNISKENRTTQSKFSCRACGHSMNADTNAAINILAKSKT